jgi:hypothetical protein
MIERMQHATFPLWQRRRRQSMHHGKEQRTKQRGVHVLARAWPSSSFPLSGSNEESMGIVYSSIGSHEG